MARPPCVGTVRPPEAATEARARSADQRRHFSVQKPAPADIFCVVAGRRLDLGSHRSEIHAYFAAKPRDEHLFAQVRSIARRSLQTQGEQLCDGAFALGDFEPVRLPDDLTWAEDPLSDRRWLWLFHGWSFTPALLALGWFADEPVPAAQRRLLGLAHLARRSEGRLGGQTTEAVGGGLDILEAEWVVVLAPERLSNTVNHQDEAHW